MPLIHTVDDIFSHDWMEVTFVAGLVMFNCRGCPGQMAEIFQGKWEWIVLPNGTVPKSESVKSTVLTDMIESVPVGWKMEIEPFQATTGKLFIIRLIDDKGVILTYSKEYSLDTISPSTLAHWRNLATTKPVGSVMNFGMFSGEGNKAVKHAMDQIKLWWTTDRPDDDYRQDMVHAIYQAAERLSVKYPEVTDTAVREAMFRYTEDW
jgi:hypothetical protein